MCDPQVPAKGIIGTIHEGRSIFSVAFDSFWNKFIVRPHLFGKLGREFCFYFREELTPEAIEALRKERDDFAALKVIYSRHLIIGLGFAPESVITRAEAGKLDALRDAVQSFKSGNKGQGGGKAKNIPPKPVLPSGGQTASLNLASLFAQN